MRHNLDDEKKEHLKKERSKRKKEKHDYLNANEKEPMKKECNKRKKSMITSVIMKKNS